jgi:serpin B
VKGANALGWHLLAKAGPGDGNVFLSPHGLATALAMTAAGARGPTAAELAHVLGAPADPAAWAALRPAAPAKGPAPQLLVANALWAQKAFPFRPEYVRDVTTHFQAAAENLDFTGDAEGARRRINAWVAGQTQERIKDLLPDGVINDQTRLVLTNAIYFKGAWAHPFDPAKTQNRPFHKAGGSTVETALMARRGALPYLAADGVQVAALPYAGGDLALIVFLPAKPDGLAAVQNQLAQGALDGWIAQMKPTEVDLWLPRFTLTTQLNLRDTLIALGMPTAFGPQADFSGMDGSRGLQLAAVVHKAFVEVNEAGTEAAAGSGAAAAVKFAPPDPVAFHADRPFLFLIRDGRTGAILFVGRFADPKG